MYIYRLHNSVNILVLNEEYACFTAIQELSIFFGNVKTVFFSWEKYVSLIKKKKKPFLRVQTKINNFIYIYVNPVKIGLCVPQQNLLTFGIFPTLNNVNIRIIVIIFFLFCRSNRTVQLFNSKTSHIK